MSESGDWQPPAPGGGSGPPDESARSGKPPPVPASPAARPPSAPVAPAPTPGRAGGPPVGPTPPPGPALPTWYAPPPTTGTDGFAIAALVLGILSFIPVAIPAAVIFGVLALRRIRRRGGGGRGLAIAGLAAAAGWGLLIAAIVVLAIVSGPIPDEPGTAPPPATTAVDSGTSAADLVVGDCFVDFGQETAIGIPRVEVVPCNEPHHVEVIAAFALPEGEYPGDDRVKALAEVGCEQRMPPKLADARRNLELSFLYPLESRWVLGEREVLCVLSSNDTLTAPLPQ